MSDIAAFALIIFCICLEGLFSGGEIALVASDINRIKNLAKQGSRGAAVALRLLEKPEWFLSTTLTGTDLCAIISTTVATALLISMFGISRGEVLSIIIMAPTLLIMSEIIPKSICQQRPESTAIWLSWFIRAASWILFPVVFIISRISQGTVRISTGEKDVIISPYITKDGLKSILNKGEAESDILSSEREIVRRILDFSEVKVGKIMVPLSVMTALPVTASYEEAVKLIAEKKHLHVPVYRDQILNIVGILHYFDLLEIQHGQRYHDPTLSPDDLVASCIRPEVLYVPETKLAKELLIELQGMGDRMAIVVDEYGAAVGIVTIEDILEAIVGEIEDEYDSGAKLFKRVGPGRYLFNAKINVEWIRQILPLEIPEGDYDTLGGFLLFRMGRIPKRKETFRQDNTLFIIEDADLKSIKEVMVTFPADLDTDSAGE